jgi:hypothetical protein
MGTRADFYIGTINPKWIGSLHKDGHPWNIPCKILIQNNPVLYEEYVVDFLMKKKGDIESMGHPWPWPWEDSQLTDYSYFFVDYPGSIVAYSMHEKITFDPLKIMQGEDLKQARIFMIFNFPKMGVGYGPNATKTI